MSAPTTAAAGGEDRPSRVTLYPALLAFSGTAVTSDGSHEKSKIASQVDLMIGRRVAASFEFGLGGGISGEHGSDGVVLGRAYGYIRPFAAGRRNTENGVRLLLGAALGTIRDRDVGLGIGPFFGLVLDHRRVLSPGLTLDLAFEVSLAVTRTKPPESSYYRGSANTFTVTPKLGLTWGFKPSPKGQRSRSSWTPKGAEKL